MGNTFFLVDNERKEALLLGKAYCFAHNMEELLGNCHKPVVTAELARAHRDGFREGYYEGECHCGNDLQKIIAWLEGRPEGAVMMNEYSEWPLPWSVPQTVENPGGDDPEWTVTWVEDFPLCPSSSQ